MFKLRVVEGDLDHPFFFFIIFTPRAFIAFIEFITSSDSNKLYPLDFPIACDANKTNLIEIDLSPGTIIELLNEFILVLIVTKFFIGTN